MVAKFSESQYVTTLPSSSTQDMAIVTPTAVKQLTKIRTRVYLHNVDSAQLRLKVLAVGTNSEEVILATSNWSQVSDIENKGTYWIGWLLFEFPSNFFIGPGQTVTLRLESGSYSYDENNSYVGLCSAFPVNSDNNNYGDSYVTSPFDFELYEVS